MKVNDKVTATCRLGGWDNEGCGGRPSERCAVKGDKGVIEGPADWIEDESPWMIARFDLADGPLWAGVAEGHVEIG